MSGSERPYIVIGAGIAGLLAARASTSAGYPVLVLEKSRGVGGRMATRRFQNGVFDHGAQFFTVREPAFAALVTGWQADGLVDLWANGFARPTSEAKMDGHPRYRGRAGMTDIPKALAESLAVRLGNKVRAISADLQGWLVHLQSGKTLAARGLVLTPPVPQSLALLEAGEVELPTDIAASLSAVTYDPCIALLALTQEASAIPVPGGIQFPAGPIRWMADNQQKGISPEMAALTIHASATFSEANWEKDDRTIAEQLLPAAAPYIRGETGGYQVHRWRYSQPRAVYPDRCLVVPGAHPLIFAGDAFGGPKIEGAAHSGMSAADRLLSWS